MTTTAFHRSITNWARPAIAGLAVVGVAAGWVGSALAAEVSVSKPVGQLFWPDAAKLSPAGERWLRLQVASNAKQPDHMVVVQIPGGTPQLQEQRAMAIRQRLTALGVASQHIYMEAAPADTDAPRMAGL